MNIKEMTEGSRKEDSREKIIIRTSIIGIIANVFLAAFKAVIGLMTNSIAIVLDAVNNISDAGSSLITIVGTRLAGKEPDKKHPFGYGRIEYLSAMIISVIVLYAGITSFVESVKQMHGFYLLKEEKSMRFDIVISFDADDRRAVYREVVSNVQKAFPDYSLQVAMDIDFAEE